MALAGIILRPMTPMDWESVAEIYRQGIETGNATFQTEVPSWDNWNSGHLKLCRIIAVCQDEIVGWAALLPVSGRSVYAGVAEVSVYVSTHHTGRKIGTNLLEKLISESEKAGFWTLQSSVFAENKASIKIHENLGFRHIGYREKIAKLNGLWRDTILLERRSKVTGIS
jgi:phosphinothricin acetyltransferase